MNDKGRNAQRPDGQPRLLVRALGIVVHKPVDRRIDRKINLRIVDCCDLWQDHGGTVCLYGGSVIKFFDILNKNPHRDLLIRIVARHINAHERNEAHLRMFLELPNDLLTRCIGGDFIEKFVHLCVPPFS